MTKRRKGVLVAAIGSTCVAAGLWTSLWRSGVPLSSEQLRRHIVMRLEENLDARVHLESVTLRFSPRLSVAGVGLVVWHREHPDVALITVERFVVSSGFRSLWRRHIDEAVLFGLAIQIPPSTHPSSPSATGLARNATGRDALREVVVDRIVADESTLTILPGRSDGHARVWRLHQLRVSSVGVDQAMPFQTVLTNAVPPGDVDSSGSFGPWRADDPGSSPVAGKFTFDHADLSVFKGIAGTLSAEGQYGGSLARLAVNGRTHTPDFTVTLGGHPVPLETSYRAVVDATNGDTTLEHVDAAFLQTTLVASGGVYDVPGVSGRHLTLDVRMDKGRLENILPLTVNTPSPTMVGALTMAAHVDLQPGPADVVEKLSLNGTFTIRGGRFTDPGVQARIGALSGRARGMGREVPTGVRSDFSGRFVLRRGRLTLSPLRFDVPGAAVELAGDYGLRDGSLAFAGDVLMDASVSRIVGGWKAFIVRPFDGLFQREGRTFVPITIGGSRQTPQFGIDRRRIFNRHRAAVPPTTGWRSIERR